MAFKFILDLIFPPNCVLCKGFSSKQTLCENCKTTFPTLINRYSVQYLSHKSLPQPLACASPFLYRGGVLRLITGIKDKDVERESEFLANYMVTTIKKEFANTNFDFVTYAPMREEKESTIGFNHAKILAAKVALGIGKPLLPNILGMREEAKTQHNLRRSQRISNAFDNIYALGEYSLHGKTVLLVDDICTTGSTLLACASLLYKMGAVNVMTITAAYVQKKL